MKAIPFPSLYHEVYQFIIHLRNLLTMVKDSEVADSGRKPQTEPVAADEPTPMDLEHSAAEAIHALQDQKLIKYQYDFIWFMQAYNELLPKVPFNSVSDYVKWLRRHGVKNPPSESQLSRHYFPQREKFPQWHFKDHKGKKTTERDRRLDLVQSFLNLLDYLAIKRQEDAKHAS